MLVLDHQYICASPSSPLTAVSHFALGTHHSESNARLFLCASLFQYALDVEGIKAAALPSSARAAHSGKWAGAHSGFKFGEQEAITSQTRA